MARSKGVTISVKVPINWDAMTKRKRQRLRQIVDRDTRAIRAFLGVIEQHEHKLLTGCNKKRIHQGKLDELTMTALKVKAGCAKRLTVPHDLKARFPRISRNELTECRQTAAALYESYLALRQKRGRRASHPCENNSTRRIPRWTFSTRFKIIQQKTGSARWWLDLRDSLDSVQEGRMLHDRLLIPLKTSPFHLNQFELGEVKAAQVFVDRNRKWWVTFAVHVSIPQPPDDSLPPAVLGIDLGIEKAACTSLVTPEKVRETRYFRQKEKPKRLRKLDNRVAALQKELSTRQIHGQPSDKVALKLRKLKDKRERVAKEYDRLLVGELRDYILKLSDKYSLCVAIGRLRNIRQAARRGNFKGRRFRGMIHSWAFSRVTESLKHQLAQAGWVVKGRNSQFRVVCEAWTSITCWRCGRRGARPKQNLFVCPTCGNKCNADMNGAINVAGRLITLTASLHSVRGLDFWIRAVERAKSSGSKARGKRPSRGKSLLSRKSDTSHSGESAVVHQAQTSLLDFGDGVGKGDNDHAVESAAEDLSVTGSDAPVPRQKKETGSVGGT